MQQKKKSGPILSSKDARSEFSLSLKRSAQLRGVGELSPEKLCLTRFPFKATGRNQLDHSMEQHQEALLCLADELSLCFLV
ncbi:hypothetical protein CEXT_649991 [Caerostris extrusa]|uniref:Uncharacterized protein n=1 Tax=Caerostris extrusa TaxID=172846 RepID=A0AAV4TMW1_CAEEX|nr:hypothetical protein CEXT_649991 [Caerostris extrusa]